jgi:predicted Fe-S protein YdhL (DUF1289 family)
MITPCIKLCQVVNNRCRGCGRTLQEISSWTTYTDQERQRIMEKLKNEKHPRRQRWLP